jgi:hypothetical protein
MLERPCMSYVVYCMNRMQRPAPSAQRAAVEGRGGQRRLPEHIWVVRLQRVVKLSAFVTTPKANRHVLADRRLGPCGDGLQHFVFDVAVPGGGY